MQALKPSKKPPLDMTLDLLWPGPREDHIKLASCHSAFTVGQECRWVVLELIEFEFEFEERIQLRSCLYLITSAKCNVPYHLRTV